MEEIVVGLVETQNIIHHYEIARNLMEITENHYNTLSFKMAETLTRGFAIGNEAYKAALTHRSATMSYFQNILNDFDAIITPAVPGQAPLFTENNIGNPIFSTVWTLCGLPCLTMPVLVSENKMPMGVQLVGKMKGDTELLRTASWFLNKLCHTDCDLGIAES